VSAVIIRHSPLEIQIGLHYWTKPGVYAADDERHSGSSAVREIKKSMIAAGLLAPGDPDDVKATDALGVWVEAICAVPWPVKIWVIPTESAP
jgi:hypothetical protein